MLIFDVLGGSFRRGDDDDDDGDDDEDDEESNKDCLKNVSQRHMHISLLQYKSSSQLVYVVRSA